MKSIGICTQFTQSDDWAFDLGLQMARLGAHKLVICHWLQSPYRLRRDIVNDDLFSPNGTVAITPALRTRFEYQLRECFEERLGDFTEVAFKLCEGQYQVELARCFRQHLLDNVLMGYQPEANDMPGGVLPQAEFAASFQHPVVLVGVDGEKSFWLNPQAADEVEVYIYPEDWRRVEIHAGEVISHR